MSYIRHIFNLMSYIRHKFIHYKSTTYECHFSMQNEKHACEMHKWKKLARHFIIRKGLTHVEMRQPWAYTKPEQDQNACA